MADIKKGDLVKLEYTGRLASTGRIFDTTDESIAKKAGIYEKSAIYGPKLVVFGSGAILPGIEEAIASLQPGKAEEFLIPAEKAFGERKPELLRMLPEKEFLKQKIHPVPGMVVTLDGILARIKSVTSGRVVVDLNHPFAGEPVRYSVKLHEIISEDSKKIEAILSSHSLSAKIEKTEKGFTVSFPPGTPKEKTESAKRVISAVVPGTSFTTA